MSGEVGKLVDQDIRKLSEWLGCEVMELHVQADHVHVVVSIPPKVSVSTYMGTIKGKIAIKLFKSYPMLKRNLIGETFLARRYFVNTVPAHEEMTKRCVKCQEEEERDQNDFKQPELF